MTLVKLYLAINFAIPQELLQDCTTVNNFSVCDNLCSKRANTTVCTVRVLKRHTVRKLYRSAKTVSARIKLLMHTQTWLLPVSLRWKYSDRMQRNTKRKVVSNAISLSAGSPNQRTRFESQLGHCGTPSLQNI